MARLLIPKEPGANDLFHRFITDFSIKYCFYHKFPRPQNVGECGISIRASTVEERFVGKCKLIGVLQVGNQNIDLVLAYRF